MHKIPFPRSLKCTFILIALLVSLVLPATAKSPHLSIGDTIPAFSLKDVDGSLFNSRDYVGKKTLIIYFYPKDETSVCTKEACSFRDSYADFEKAGAMVVGINSGSVESHKAFKAHHQLPFILLSDPGNQVLKRFGVKSKLIITGRETFVVDLQGKVIYTYNSMTQGAKHAEEALRFIRSK